MSRSSSAEGRPPDTWPFCASGTCRISSWGRAGWTWILPCAGLGETFDTDLIVSTAGGILNGALLRAGLVDEVDLQVLPLVLGNKGAPAVFEGYNPDFASPPYRLSLIEQQARPDGSLLLRFATGKG